MQRFVTWKIIPLVLALSIATPQAAYADIGITSVDDELDTFEANVLTVLSGMDTMISVWSASKRVVKALSKGKSDLDRARTAATEADTPKDLKGVGKYVKKWSVQVDKAVKGTDFDTGMVSAANNWAVLLLVPLIAIITFALSFSLNWFNLFKKSTEKKHIKTDARLIQAFTLFGMTGGFFVANLFAWDSNSKKGISRVMSALAISIVLLTFILAQQSP